MPLEYLHRHGIVHPNNATILLTEAILNLPVLVIMPDGTRRLFEHPEPFVCERILRVTRPRVDVSMVEETYEDPKTALPGVRTVEVEVVTMVEVDEVDTVTHPASAWASYTGAEFEAACPGWSFLPVRYTAHDRTKVSAVPKPIGEWLIHADHAEVTYQVDDLPPSVTRADKVRAINAERDRRLAMGAPYAGRRVEVSDRGRADLGGMVSAAMLASNGLTPWGEGYARGWIAMDNERIPLPTPADGIQLAAAVGDWYGLVMQHARDLKDQAEAGNPADVDELADWPGDELAEAAA